MTIRSECQAAVSIQSGEANMTEQEFKLERARVLMQEHGLAGLLLDRVSSFAWGTCGASSYVNTAGSFGEASLLITPDEQYVLTNNIEAPRLEQEEGLVAAGWKMHIQPWHSRKSVITELTRSGLIGADSPILGCTDLSNEVAHLRANLTAQEVNRFQNLGQGCARVMDQAIRSVRPGMSEYQIAALLGMAALTTIIFPFKYRTKIILVIVIGALIRFAWCFLFYGSFDGVLRKSRGQD